MTWHPQSGYFDEAPMGYGFVTEGTTYSRGDEGVGMSAIWIFSLISWQNNTIKENYIFPQSIYFSRHIALDTSHGYPSNFNGKVLKSRSAFSSTPPPPPPPK